MLVLAFEIAQGRYGLDARRIIEVLPLAELRTVPGAPDAIAGLLNFRGHPIPVLDLCRLLLGRAADTCLSTRILLVDYRADDGNAHPLGLIVERATQTLSCAVETFQPSGIRVDGAPFLGAVSTAAGMLQLIELDQLVAPALRRLLFPAAAGTPAVTAIPA